MDIHKHEHLTFFTNYILKRGHFNDILNQFAHKENVKLPKFEFLYILKPNIFIYIPKYKYLC